VAKKRLKKWRARKTLVAEQEEMMRVANLKRAPLAPQRTQADDVTHRAVTADVVLEDRL
jgi:hypothetical protein